MQGESVTSSTAGPSSSAAAAGIDDDEEEDIADENTAALQIETVQPGKGRGGRLSSAFSGLEDFVHRPVHEIPGQSTFTGP